MTKREPDGVTIRRLGPADLPFLRRMLDAAVFWRPQPQSVVGRVRQRLVRPFLRLIVRRYLALYHAGWGRPGDLGVIAEIDGEPVGAAWYRFFTNDSHGDGFIDEQTPELAIAVSEGYRGRGIGRALLLAVAHAAREAGVGRIGLSVDHDNPAKRLYASVGYRELKPDDPEGRMLVEFRSRTAR
jgi:ribosomal protein S18 acetylase RimI-like enzyme